MLSTRYSQGGRRNRLGEKASFAVWKAWAKAGRPWQPETQEKRGERARRRHREASIDHVGIASYFGTQRSLASSWAESDRSRGRVSAGRTWPSAVGMPSQPEAPALELAPVWPSSGTAPEPPPLVAPEQARPPDRIDSIPTAETVGRLRSKTSAWSYFIGC
jgi:hypothetical protein